MIVSSHLDGCISLTPFLMVSVASALSQSESGLFLPPGSDGGLLSGPMALFLEETIEVPMRVGSSSSLSGLRTVDFFPVFPRVFAPGSLSQVSTSPVWSTGWFWLLGAGIRTVSPVLSLASSHSGVCTIRVGVHPCSLTHCGVPWLVAWRPCHCLITAGLATMDGPQLASAVESQLCCRPSHGGAAPVDWLRGVFPCFDHLPSF